MMMYFDEKALPKKALVWSVVFLILLTVICTLIFAFSNRATFTREDLIGRSTESNERLKYHRQQPHPLYHDDLYNNNNDNNYNKRKHNNQNKHLFLSSSTGSKLAEDQYEYEYY